MTDLAEVLVMQEEQCRLISYLDTEGVPTNGWGHTGPDVYYPGQVITQDKADAWLVDDMKSARATASEYPNYYTDMNEVRQAVLVSMSYQMGSKPLHWPHFMAFLRAKDYTSAAEAGRDSDWWRDQTRTRAEREMTMLETGLWVGPR